MNSLLLALLAFQQPASSAAAVARQDSIERLLLAVPDTQSARLMTRDLTVRPHVAGRPEQATTRDYVIDKMKTWGLETWTKEYRVYLPWPDTVRAWLLLPGSAAQPLSLREPAIPTDQTTLGPQVPPFNGYTGDGDVTTEVVYVNYGLIEDYRSLESLGVNVKGKIAIA